MCVRPRRGLLTGQMPRLHGLLCVIGSRTLRAHERRHYRIIDVSVLRELGARWYPELRDRPDRHESDHRALSDIKQSMAGAQSFHVAVSLTPADLRHLRGSMFVPPS